MTDAITMPHEYDVTLMWHNLADDGVIEFCKSGRFDVNSPQPAVNKAGSLGQICHLSQFVTF